MAEWRPVVGFEGLYEVSFAGEVRSWHPRTRGRVLKPTPNTSGYLSLYLCDASGRHGRTVHRLVAEAFHGPCPAGHETRHLDGTRTNNCAENLAWGTPSENNLDKRAHGTDGMGGGATNPRAPWANQAAKFSRLVRLFRLNRQLYPTQPNEENIMTDLTKPDVLNVNLSAEERIENLEILTKGAFAAVHDLAVIAAMMIADHPIDDKAKQNLATIVHGSKSVMDMSSLRRGAMSPERDPAEGVNTGMVSGDSGSPPEAS